MGDVLPPKRQTVVERLKRRFELYRKHQNACLPRYEQAENGLYETQRQETLLLKQRYLESKAKKAKSNKSDHHRSYKDSVTDGGKSQVHTKPVKRPLEDPVPNPSLECTNSEDNEKPPKSLRTDITSEKLSDLKTQQPPLPSFPVQIVPQFTAKTPHGPKPQTLQPSVTVPPIKKPLTSPISQPASSKPPQEPVSKSQDSHQSSNVHPVANIECKQEKDCNQMDLCQFKTAHNPTSDRLSDTFPSLGFTDDSGDDVIHPDLLKDLIDDVFTNSTDIMKDFNFDDSVGSIKDQEDATKDIISDLMKESSPIPIRTFQTDSLSFVNNSVNKQQQPNGLFKNISSSNEVPLSVMVTSTSTPTTSVTNFYTAPTQRLPTYGGSSSLNMPNGLGLDFKLTEPSPAALTLKQMAEQHQNMQQKQQQQQQQLVNSPLTTRPFNQDAFNPHMNHLRSTGNYLPGTNSSLPSSNPKTPNSNNMFTAFDRQMNNMNNFPNNEPLNNLSMSPNTIFESDIHSRTSNVIPEVDHSKQSSCMPVQQQQQQQKPPSYVSVRPLTHFSENSQVRLQNPVNNPQQRPMGRQFQNSIQMVQAPQMHTNQGHHNNQQLQNSHDLNQQQHHMMHQSHSNPYVSFPSQQPINNSTFHVSQNISYSNQFASNQTINRPPPEYKTHQSNLPMDNVNIIEQLNTPSHVMFNQHNSPKDKFMKTQRPPNVTITADGSVIRAPSSMDWRHVMNDQQNRLSTFRNNYNNFVQNEHPVQQPQMFNQYRMPGNQMATNRMIRPNIMPNHMIIQQRQRVTAPQRSRNPSAIDQHSSMGISNSVLPTLTPGYNSHQDMSRSDGSQINLDFLDNIESSASDLLNFDQVMQVEGTHFPLLDDMEILGK